MKKTNEKIEIIENINEIKKKIKHSFKKNIKALHPDYNNNGHIEAIKEIERYKNMTFLLKKIEKYYDNDIFITCIKIKKVIDSIIFTGNTKTMIKEIIHIKNQEYFKEVNFEIIFNPGELLRYPYILFIYKCFSQTINVYGLYIIKNIDVDLFRIMYLTRVDDLINTCNLYPEKDIVKQFRLLINIISKYIFSDLNT
jgi:hypothetical protein